MSKEILRDVRIRINDLDISALCTTISLQAVSDEFDITGYSSECREFVQGEAGTELNLDLILGTDGSATVTATDEETPVLTGGSAYWNGLLFDALYATGDTAVIDVSPHSTATAATNPLFTVVCRLTAWKPLDGDVGKPAKGSLKFMSVGALEVTTA